MDEQFEAEEIVPQACPFCGKMATVKRNEIHKLYRVSCASLDGKQLSCHLVSPIRPSVYEAIAAWNRIQFRDAPGE